MKTFPIMNKIDVTYVVQGILVYLITSENRTLNLLSLILKVYVSTISLERSRILPIFNEITYLSKKIIF